MVAQADVELMTAARCALNKRLVTIAGMMNLIYSRPTGCLLVTHLPVKAELLRRPELAGQPLVVTAGTPGRQTVLDASVEAVGVRAGQRLRKRCPAVPAPLPCWPIPSTCPRSTTGCWLGCAK